jgi:hypothetical protein
MKTPKFLQLHPLIDPAFLYLSGFFLFVGVVILLGNAYLASGATSSHYGSSGLGGRQFPEENEVHSAVRMGQTEDDVLNEMGQPLSRGPLADGVTVLNYVKPMSQNPANDSSIYCGFAVYLKSGKVMDIDIIHGSDLREKGER